MYSANNDTIAAVATAPGRGGVGIVRVSGPKVREVASVVLQRMPEPRYAQYGHFYHTNGQIIDTGIALYFAAPHSFTGEEVLELQGHGGPVVLDMLLQVIIALGCRLARPGEFSERAFLNDKLDLAQAEAISDLIDCASEQAARCAMRSLQGEFSQAVQVLLDGLINLRVYIEAALDFPEEEIDFLADKKVMQMLLSVEEQLQSVLLKANQGSILREGMNVVIAGRPNAGKSSLLNTLAGHDRAIVTDIAGTTRDVLREQIQIDGMPLHLIDTAGLRAAPDKVEQIGVQRAWDEIASADRLLLVLDSQTNPDPHQLLHELYDEHSVAGQVEQIIENGRLTVIRNKIDLGLEKPRIEEREQYTVISLSAKHGTGIELLTEHLKAVMGYHNGAEGGFLARRRHIDALNRAHEAIMAGKDQLEGYAAGELLAEDLKIAQHALGEITGSFTADDLLGEIFGSFCIGK